MDAQEARGVGVPLLALEPDAGPNRAEPFAPRLMWFDLKIGSPDVSEPESLKAFHGFCLSNPGIRLANPGRTKSQGIFSTNAVFWMP